MESEWEFTPRHPTQCLFVCTATAEEDLCPPAWSEAPRQTPQSSQRFWKTTKLPYKKEKGNEKRWYPWARSKWIVGKHIFFSIQTNRLWLNMSVVLTSAPEGKRRRGRPRETWRRTVNKEREHVWFKARRGVEVAGRYRVAWRRRIDGPMKHARISTSFLIERYGAVVVCHVTKLFHGNTFHGALRDANGVCLPVRHVHRGWHVMLRFSLYQQLSH